MCSDVISAVKAQCEDMPNRIESVIVGLTKKFRLPRKAKKRNPTPVRFYYHTTIGVVRIHVDHGCGVPMPDMRLVDPIEVPLTDVSFWNQFLESNKEPSKFTHL